MRAEEDAQPDNLPQVAIAAQSSNTFSRFDEL